TARIRDIVNDCVIERGDICDLPRLLGIIARYQPSAIAHISGQVGPHVEQLPWSSLNTNLMGAATIFEAARLSGIPRIVFSSAKQVYGILEEKHRHPGYEPVSEDHPRGDPPRFYGKLKRACEDIAEHYARLYGLDIIALRFGSSYGPGKFGRDETVSPVVDM